jgi:hypothetical protein
VKRLITERDVQQMAPGSRLELGRDTIVTPAARDLAFARRIELVEAGAAASTPDEKCGCSGCKAGKPCDCSRSAEGPWPRLADGDYLIEVRGGRVRVRRVDR